MKSRENLHKIDKKSSGNFPSPGVNCGLRLGGEPGAEATSSLGGHRRLDHFWTSQHGDLMVISVFDGGFHGFIGFLLEFHWILIGLFIIFS